MAFRILEVVQRLTVRSHQAMQRFSELTGGARLAGGRWLSTLSLVEVNARTRDALESRSGRVTNIIPFVTWTLVRH